MGGRGSSSTGGGGRLVSVASIADRLIALPGARADAARYERVKAGLREGKDLGPVLLNRLPNGKLFVEQGRHRLHAARELGIKVRAKIGRAYAETEIGTVPLFKK